MGNVHFVTRNLFKLYFILFHFISFSLCVQGSVCTCRFHGWKVFEIQVLKLHVVVISQCGCFELNSEPLQDQHALLTVKHPSSADSVYMARNLLDQRTIQKSLNSPKFSIQLSAGALRMREEFLSCVMLLFGFLNRLSVRQSTTTYKYPIKINWEKKMCSSWSMKATILTHCPRGKPSASPDSAWNAARHTPVAYGPLFSCGYRFC